MPFVPKAIPPHERLIFAMDVADPAEARQLADKLGDSVHFYKLGLELFMSGGYYELLDWMVARGKKVFVDLKFFDVPATVAAAVRQLRNRGVTLTTVHGNQGIMEAAAAAKGDVKVLAVTVLTSLDRGDLDDLGFTVDVEKLGVPRAGRRVGGAMQHPGPGGEHPAGRPLREGTRGIARRRWRVAIAHRARPPGAHHGRRRDPGATVSLSRGTHHLVSPEPGQPAHAAPR